MGCFESKEAHQQGTQTGSYTAAIQAAPAAPPRALDPVDSRVFQHKSGVGGLKIFPCVANWQAGAMPSGFNRVVILGDAMFLARFDAVGTGTAAATACEAASYGIFADAMRQCSNNVPTAFGITFRMLDAMLVEKADCVGSGCSAVMAHMDLKSHRVVVGTVGQCHAFVGRATGSFRDASSEPMWLLDGRQYRPALKELAAWLRDQLLQPSVRTSSTHAPRSSLHHAAASSSGRVSGSGGAQPGSQPLAPPAAPPPGPTTFRPSGPLQVLGFGRLKEQVAAAAASAATSAAAAAVAAAAACREASGVPGLTSPAAHTPVPAYQVVTHALSSIDQHLLLVSDGCLDSLGPADAVLFACQFETSQMQLLKDACTVTPARHGYSNSFQDIEPSEVDERPLRGNNFNVAQLLVRHAAHKLPGVKAGQPTGHTSDVGMLALALDWPKSITSHQMNMAKVIETRRVNNPMATYRWHLVCQYIKYAMHRRRRLLRSWYATCTAAIRHAEVEARQKEVAAWKYLGEAVQVSRTGQVMRSAPGTLEAAHAADARLSQHAAQPQGFPTDVTSASAAETPPALGPPVPPGPDVSGVTAGQPPCQPAAACVHKDSDGACMLPTAAVGPPPGGPPHAGLQSNGSGSFGVSPRALINGGGATFCRTSTIQEEDVTVGVTAESSDSNGHSTPAAYKLSGSKAPDPAAPLSIGAEDLAEPSRLAGHLAGTTNGSVARESAEEQVGGVSGAAHGGRAAQQQSRAGAKNDLSKVAQYSLRGKNGSSTAAPVRGHGSVSSKGRS